MDNTCNSHKHTSSYVILGGSFTSARSCTNLPPARPAFPKPRNEPLLQSGERKKEMHDQGGISLFLQESVSNSRVLTWNAALQPQQRKRRWGDARCRLFFFMHTRVGGSARARSLRIFIWPRIVMHSAPSNSINRTVSQETVDVVKFVL